VADLSRAVGALAEYLEEPGRSPQTSGEGLPVGAPGHVLGVGRIQFGEGNEAKELETSQ
jgi:hypothetical protein